MSDDVTEWIHGLAKGDELAAQAIFERYFNSLVRLAGRHLGNLPRRAIDVGLDGIAYPADGIVAYVQERGLEPVFVNACCGVSW